MRDSTYSKLRTTAFLVGTPINALMSHLRSGAGKTTLLDVASMRRSSGRLTGGVLIGGAPVSRPLLKRITAYVQQEDALCGWCSIEETLLFTANMKLRVRLLMPAGNKTRSLLSIPGYSAPTSLMNPAGAQHD